LFQSLDAFADHFLHPLAGTLSVGSLAAEALIAAARA
jgi:hypothetical protein